MTNKPYRFLLRQTSHPTDDELLGYVDGELDTKAASRLGNHLKSCWSCRLKREKMDRLISDFMESRRLALRGSNPPEGGLNRLLGRLDRLDHELERVPSQSSWLHFLTLTFPKHRWISLSAITLLLIAAILKLTTPPPVSAREILERVRRAEAQQVQKVGSPVVYRKLRLRRESSVVRGSQSLSWEIWNDIANARFRQRVHDERGERFIGGGFTPALQPMEADGAPKILVELQQIFATNNMDILNPVSSSTYENWQRRLGERTESVEATMLRDGGDTLTLITTPGSSVSSGLVSAELVVRKQDWHPVEENLEVQADGEVLTYRLTETAFGVLTLNLLPPSIFADLNTPVAPPSDSAAVNLVRATENLEVPSLSELVNAEVEALFALHRAKVCLGEAVEVLRDRSLVRVRGVVDQELRRDELRDALRGISFIRMEVQTVEEALKSSDTTPLAVSGEDLPNGPEIADYSEPSKGFLLQQLLHRYFKEDAQLTSEGSQRSVHAQITTFANEAISLSQASLAEAWALRHLAEWSIVNRAMEIRPQARWLIEVTVRDHSRALEDTLSRSQKLLRPVILPRNSESNAKTGQTVAPRASQEGSTWENECLELFSQVEQWERLMRVPFVGAGGVKEAEDSLQAAFAACPLIQYQIAKVESVLATQRSRLFEDVSQKRSGE